jgi:hypothetical protein
MGTWGPGNFDNDGAHDYANDLVHQLRERVAKAFRKKHGADIDGDGESVVVPAIFIMGLLAAHCKAALPESSLLEDWRDRYLKLYDDQIDGLEPKGDYKPKRRRTIVNSFNKVIRLSRGREEHLEEIRRQGARRRKGHPESGGPGI